MSFKHIFFALAIFALPSYAQSDELVQVDLTKITGAPLHTGFPNGAGINNLQIGMTLDQVKSTLEADGYRINDLRNIVANLNFKPDGIAVSGQSLKFVGRVLASKDTPNTSESFAVYFTTPMTEQRAYQIYKSVRYSGNVLDLPDITNGMFEKWGEPSLNFRRTAIRYISWYKDIKGRPLVNYEPCAEMPGKAGGIRASYMNQFDYFSELNKLLKQGCSAVIASVVTQGLDTRREDVEGFDITVYDNVMHVDELRQLQNVLKGAVDAKNFRKPEISKPKF